MKRFLTFLYATTCLVVSAAAQARFTSNTQEHRLGQIEWKHPVTAEFVITNTGDRPLVMSEVEPDCACAVAQWTQTPIAPGGKGTVSVTFDAEALGHFYKSVAVITNAEPHVVYLSLSGEVVQEIKDFSRTHPYLIGDIRLDQETLDFPDAHRGEHPVLQLGVANLSALPYEPVLMHLPPYLSAEYYPEVLAGGRMGKIMLTLDSEKLRQMGLTQASIYLAREMGDKVSDENEIVVSSVLLPDFSSLSVEDRELAPNMVLSADTVDLGEMGRKRKKSATLTIQNTGKRNLEIRALQVFNKALAVELSNRNIGPGETAKLKVTVLARYLKKAKNRPRVLLITNDPAHSKEIITVNVKQDGKEGRVWSMLRTMRLIKD